MSYRILRKLQGNELEIKDPIDEISDGADADYDTNSVGSQTRKKININRFDLVSTIIEYLQQVICLGISGVNVLIKI